MKKKLFMLLIIGILAISTTGCRQDDMEDIDIAVTNYPNEFVVERLYGKHAKINQVYPDGVNTEKYQVTKRQKQNYADMGLFVYTGLVEKERNLAVSLLDINKDLKIIDTSYVLMMAQNVRLGLKEYITSTYLTKEVDEAYNKLKIDLSELDADYRLTVENTDNKVIVVSDSALKFLEKFGLKVICLDSDATDKDIAEVNTMAKAGTINYIYTFKEEELSENAKTVMKQNSNLKKLELNKLNVISDKDRDDGKDYITLMNENLDTLKQELYQ